MSLAPTLSVTDLILVALIVAGLLIAHRRLP